MTPRGEMPFLDHLEELRWRILWSLVAIVVGTIVGWVLLDKIDIIDILKRPIARTCRAAPGLYQPRRAVHAHAESGVRAGLPAGIADRHLSDLGVLSPALYERERRLIVPALAVGVVLFLAGRWRAISGCCRRRSRCCSASSAPTCRR